MSNYVSWWSWHESLLPTAGIVLQVPTPAPDVGPDELVEFWPVLVRIGWFFAAFLAVVFISRIALQPAFARIISRRNRNNPTLQDALLLYFRLLIFLLAVLVGAGVAGYGQFLSDSALILSAIALAVGVAAQEVIGSLVSGMALVFDPEFNVGNYIEWSDGQGVVQSIALRVTRVETAGGELVTIPNTILTSNEIVRPFGRGNYRIVQTIGIGYDADLEEAMTQIENAAASVDGILSEPPPAVYIGEFGDDAVIVRIHYWVEDPNRREVVAIRSQYAQSVKEHLEDAEITFSPPSEHALEGHLEIDERSDSE